LVQMLGLSFQQAMREISGMSRRSEAEPDP
jgi:hypothetical protein